MRQADARLPILSVSGFPPGVGAVMTWRGSDPEPYGFNLALHTGDEPERVRFRRAALSEWIQAEPVWLNQVHGKDVALLKDRSGTSTLESPTADASLSRDPGLACTVLVADCLPVLMSLASGEAVAAAHAGWRGLAAGVLEASLDALAQGAPQRVVVAWLGPCIGPSHFEVGPDVLEAFGGLHGNQGRHFRPSPDRPDRWFADLQGLAMTAMLRWSQQSACRLEWAGPPGGCSVQDQERWFSYRRESRTGRMAACIWRENQESQ